MNQFDILKKLIQKEIDNVIVKDTYSKGKNAGLRKCLMFIEDIEQEDHIMREEDNDTTRNEYNEINNIKQTYKSIK